MKWLSRSAAAGAGWALFLIVLSLAGLHPSPFPIFVLLLAVLGFPVFVAGVITSSQLQRTAGIRVTALLLRLPLNVRVLLGVAIALFWIAGMIGILGLGSSGGNPERLGDQYALESHGTVTVVSQAVYERAQMWEGLAASGIPGCFCIAGSALCAALATRSTRPLGQNQRGLPLAFQERRDGDLTSGDRDG